MAEEPKSVEIRTYQVGFGDCFLMSLRYATSSRHVLIDFGTKRLPKWASKDHMVRIADDIRKTCDKEGLDILVATHRHTDHISGFATNASGTASGDIIRSCNPRIVVQPWTEDPKAAKDAQSAPAGTPKAFVATLENMHAVAEGAVSAARALRRSADAESLEQVDFIGSDNIKNRSAVENLIRMGRRQGTKNFYVQYDSTIPTGGRLPGVKIYVLGPPTLAEKGDLTTERRKDEDEYWHLAGAAGTMSAGGGAALFPGSATRDRPLYARWFIDRMKAGRAEALLGIVRTLDKSMNNTSVILLFEIAGKFLLFPGDAQIENWEYALGKKKYDKQLKNVTVYKVGHHGSLNATPKTLWKHFESHRGPKTRRDRLTAIMSTMPNVYGKAENDAEVPRGKLKQALTAETDLLDTEAYKQGDLVNVLKVNL